MSALTDQITQRILNLQAQVAEIQSRADKDIAQTNAQITALQGALSLLAKAPEAEALLAALTRYKLLPQE